MVCQVIVGIDLRDKEVIKESTCLMMNTNKMNMREIIITERRIKWH
jgi:hypothetical protein